MLAESYLTLVDSTTYYNGTSKRIFCIEIVESLLTLWVNPIEENIINLLFCFNKFN